MTESFEMDLDRYVQAIYGKKVLSLVALDIRGKTSIADAYLICAGRSHRQVSAISEHIRRDLKESNLKPLSVEGEKEGQWVVLDYGHVVIHVFLDPVRTFYDLEGLWADAPNVETPAMLTEKAKPVAEPDDFEMDDDFEMPDDLEMDDLS